MVSHSHLILLIGMDLTYHLPIILAVVATVVLLWVFHG